MPRFHFDIRTAAGRIDDAEGGEHDDLDAALAEALQAARDLMGEAILIGDDVSSRCIEIRDEAGDLVMRVPFSDAVVRKD